MRFIITPKVIDMKINFQSDLAARNVLLTHDKRAKIADFGLSTRIYFNTSERKGPVENMVPVSWAALEILRGNTSIIEYSDVWSFGVFMWEIFYVGSAVPYGDKKDFNEIIEFLQGGHRLGNPPLCPKHIHELMLECWYENHLYRPTFKQLKTGLKRVANPEQQTAQENDMIDNNLTYSSLMIND